MPQSVSELKKEWVISTVDSESVSINGYKGSEKEIEIPAMVGNKKVTRIGERAFRPESHKGRREVYRNLRSIKLPETLTYIGQEAFANCKGLRNINLPDALESISNSAFEGCVSLECITIPAKIGNLQSCVFSNCTGLKECLLKSPNTGMGRSVFFDCTSLTQLKVIMSDGFLADYLIHPDYFNSCEYALAGCTSLTAAKFAPDASCIPDGIFCGCTALEEMSIPEGVKRIGRDAFRCCESLRHITIPKTVEVIEDWAFLGMKNLESVEVLSPDLEIQPDAFKDCPRVSMI